MKSIVKLVQFSIVLLLIDFNQINGLNVLSVFPTTSKSHWLLGATLLKGLVKNGHNVTMVSGYALSEPIENYRDIQIDGLIDAVDGVRNVVHFNKMNQIQHLDVWVEMGRTISNYTLRHERFQKLLNDRNEHFDIILLDLFFNEAMLGLGHHYKAPIIFISALAYSKWAYDMTGSPMPLSYVPGNFGLHLTDRMSFIDRMKNVLYSMYSYVHTDLFHIPMQKQIYEEIFHGEKPTLGELTKNVSLIMLNTHFSIGYPKPYTPNMIEVGGLHLTSTNTTIQRQQLSEDLKQFLDDAPDGVIYFSLGNNIHPWHFDEKTQNAIFRVLSERKERILWKWDNKSIANAVPANIMIRDWFPQNEILAHPNVKAFISHGGILGIIEAINAAVPMIGIPIFADQTQNMMKVERDGCGIMIRYKHLNYDTLSMAIDRLVNDPSYKQKIDKFSMAFKDQPMKPLDKAVYWVEYIGRHQGAPFMRAAGLNLNTIQYYNLDVFALIIIIILFSIIMLRSILNALFGLKCKKSSTKIKTN